MSRERDRPSSRSSRQQDLLVKLRGIPSNSTKDNVKKFLHPCRVVNVHFFINNGQTTNECFVDLDSDRDLREALRNHKTSMDRRTVEVVRATSHEFKFFVKHKGSKSWRDPVLRLDGLPISCTMADIQNFFKGIEIATNGIYISRDMSDNASGGGYVAFVDMDSAYKAADLFDREHLQDSRIDLTPSTYEEAKETILKDARRNGKRFADEPEDEEEKKVDEKKPAKEDQTPRKEHREPAAKRRRSSSPSPRVPARPEKRPARRSRSPVRRSSPKPNRQGEYVVKMRGMPFTVKESDVTKFFPSSCRPVRIEIIHDRRTERPNGDGFAYFTSRDDAYEAMKCHRKYMGKRYIELYLESSPQPKRSRSPRKSASRSPQKSASRSPIETDNRDEEPEAVEREENEEADERAEEEEEEQEEEREQREERDGKDENDDERSPSRSESEH